MHAQKVENHISEILDADITTLLKTRFPDVYNRLRQEKCTLSEDRVRAMPAKSGAVTLSVEKNGRNLYLHSRYDPVREAGQIADQYPDMEKYRHLIFYGTGLGYHILEFARRYPDKQIYIHEPDADVFCHFLSSGNLARLPARSLQSLSFGFESEDVNGLLKKMLQKAREQTLVIELPAHREIFPEAHQAFSELFKKRIQERRTGVVTNYKYQKRWIFNSMANFPHVLHTPNVLMGHDGVFEGKPAILVAAGPSLNQEIENIRHIKKQGLAYIFTVGSAVNTLVYHGIYPHAACTYDPQKVNKKVFDKIVEQQIHEIPMIFGSSVGYETIMHYPGPKLHMLTSQDTVAGYFLKTASGDAPPKVADAPTIAIVTLELLARLGFSRVILAGQNLSFKDRKRHADGVHYSKEISDAEMKKALWIKDVDGGEVMTSQGFDSMRLQMEACIRMYPDVMFVNTTAGGAAIEGAPFRSLKQVLKEELTGPVVDENWRVMENHCYDPGYLENRLNEMIAAFDQHRALVLNIRKNLQTVEKLCRNRNFSQASKTYTKIDRLFSDIKANAFFKTFILPMNRVYYEMLTGEIRSLQEEKNQQKKGQRVIDAFGRFLGACDKDMNMMTKVFPRIQSAAQNYIQAAG